MKKILHAFKPFVVETLSDLMLFACLLGPILAGIFFHYGVPLLERELCMYYGREQLLYPFYAIFDLFIMVLAPIMFCFAGVMVILEERDCGVAKYYVVTPLGKKGYLTARIILPGIVAYFYDLILIKLFSISEMKIPQMVSLSIGGCLLAIVTALIVLSFANNKMEGLALVKLSSIVILGIPISYFVTGPIKYLFGFLPSFWMAELCRTGKDICVIPMVGTGIFLIAVLYAKFKKKLI